MELRECPFCGLRDLDLIEMPTAAWITCNVCAVEIKAQSREAAIVAWNRRADGSTTTRTAERGII